MESRGRKTSVSSRTAWSHSELRKGKTAYTDTLRRREGREYKKTEHPGYNGACTPITLDLTGDQSQSWLHSKFVASLNYRSKIKIWDWRDGSLIKITVDRSLVPSTTWWLQF